MSITLERLIIFLGAVLVALLFGIIYYYGYGPPPTYRAY